MNKWLFIKKALEEREQNHQKRNLALTSTSFNIINFSANDYLGLSQHPYVKKCAAQALEKYGAGATGSRLITGNYRLVEEVEAQIAQLKQTPAALLFSSGFQANISLIPLFADHKSLIIADKLIHNSLMQGALLSHAKLLRYRHNDYQHLEEILAVQHQKYTKILIITESVFSMDGDCCDLDLISKIAKKYQAYLMVDDAHATGVIGENGMGMTAGKKIDLTIGTFSKGAGSFGAYVACSEILKEYIVNFCSGFIYSTAMPPAVVGAIQGALELIPTMEKERSQLQQQSLWLRNSLHQLGYETGGSSTQIIPLYLGSEKLALSLSQWLKNHGIMAMAIRPPTVAKGTSRIRLALSTQHSQADLEFLIDQIKAWHGSRS